MTKLFGNREFIKKYFILALPLILQTLLVSSVRLIDNIMVSGLGEKALSAVGSAGQALFIGDLMIFGICGGAGIYTAQYFGAKNIEKVKETFRIKFIFSVVFAILYSSVILILKESILNIFLETDEALSLGKDYLTIMALYPVINAASFSISSTFKETNHTMYAILPSIVAIFVNTFLNWILIYGNLGFNAYGIRGAAFATVVARAVEFSLLCMFIFFKRPIFATRLKNLFVISGSLLKKVLSKVLPIAFNELLWAVSMSTLFFVYSTRGELALAAINVSDALKQLMFSVFSGVQVVIAIMVGKVLGEDKLDEAYDNSKKILSLSVLLAFFVGLVFIFITPLFLSIYGSLDESTLNTAKLLIYIDCIGYPLYMIGFAIFFFMRAGGDTTRVLIVDSVFNWIILVPFALYLTTFEHLTLLQIRLLILCVEPIKTLLFLIFYFQKNWVKNLTTEA